MERDLGSCRTGSWVLLLPFTVESVRQVPTTRVRCRWNLIRRLGVIFNEVCAYTALGDTLMHDMD